LRGKAGSKGKQQRRNEHHVFRFAQGEVLPIFRDISQSLSAARRSAKNYLPFHESVDLYVKNLIMVGRLTAPLISQRSEMLCNCKPVYPAARNFLRRVRIAQTAEALPRDPPLLPIFISISNIRS
jgi:hypothetical protein